MFSVRQAGCCRTGCPCLRSGAEVDHLVARQEAGHRGGPSDWAGHHRGAHRQVPVEGHPSASEAATGADSSASEAATDEGSSASTTVACWAELRAAIVALANAWVVAVADVAGLRHCWA